MRLAAQVVFAICLSTAALHAAPNIVWIISEDMGPDLGCWGVNVSTPHIDQLASEGVRFTRMFGTASVCMPNRTAMITGVTQTTLGSITMRPPKEHMRALPNGVAPLPALLNDLGYFTANVRDKRLGTSGKNDWNFRYEGDTWQSGKLDDLAGNQPFYAQFNIQQAHRPYKEDETNPVDPATVDLPPYYPNHPVMRKSWSDYLETIQLLDRKVGLILKWLEEEKLAKNTIVFFLSDHGEAFLRGKYFLYDCSLNQPLIVRWPKDCDPPRSCQPGSTDERMIASVDLAAQTLDCAGSSIPEWMHGRPFLGAGHSSGRAAIFSAADWIGGSRIKSRSVRTDRYKYIRNYNTELSVTSASSEYRKAHHPLFHLVHLLADRDELSPLHRRLLYDPFPEEELYDLRADPHELNNLAADSDHVDAREVLSRRLDDWIESSGDLGFEPLDPQHIAFFNRYKAKGERNYAAQQNRARQAVEAEHERYLATVEK